MITRKILLTAALGALINLSVLGNVSADDTDIYLDSSSNVSTTDVLPKIMIIVDNSGSMETHSIPVEPAYDPSYTYTGGSWDATRVYWSSTSAEPTDPTTNYFSKSNLSCQGALDAFGKASGGHYDNDSIFMWSKAPGTNGKWAKISDLQATTPGFDSIVECEGDSFDVSAGDYNASDAAPSGAGANGKYFYKNSNSGNNTYLSGGYTNTSNQAAGSTFYNGMETLSLWDGNYLNYRETASATQYKSRMQIAQQAVNEIVTTTNGVEIGMMTYNPNNSSGEDGGHVVRRVDRMTASSRTDLQTITDSLSGYANNCQERYDTSDNKTVNCSGSQTYTPLAETLYEAYRYFAGVIPDMGGRTSIDNPICTWSGCYDTRPLSDYCAQDDSSSSKCASYSSGTSRSTVAGYFPTAGSSQPDTTQPAYTSPLQNSCEKAYIVLITDGDPTNDSNRNTEIDALVNGAKYSATKYVPGDTWSGGTYNSNDRLDDLAGWMANNDINSSINGNQTAVLFTVGFKQYDTTSGTYSISASGEELLKRAAYVSGGEYLTADNATTLTEKLQAVIYSITTTTSSFAAPSLSVNAFNKLYNRDEIYFSLFKPELYKRWAGNIKKFTLCTQVQADAGTCEYGEVIDKNSDPAIDITTSRIKSTSVSYWNSVTDGGDVETGGAGKVMFDDGYANRNMYTYLGSYSGLSSTTPATPIAVDSASTATFETTMEATPALLGMSTTSTAAQVQAMTQWIRGQDSYDENNDGSTSDNRWVFADPLHSRPLAITFGALKTGTQYDYNSPVIKLLVAGNDGVIRLIDEDSGKEQWSFIPKEALKDSQAEATNSVGSHIYGVDSTVVVYQYDNNQDGILDYADGDRMYAFVGMRRGSKNGQNNPGYNNIYAFDMSPTSVVTSYTDMSAITPKLMWVIEGGTGEYTQLGQTWSRPQVGTLTVYNSGTKTGTYTTKDELALFFGGGNNTGVEASVVPTSGTGSGNAVFIANALTGARMFWASDPSATDGNGDGPDLPLTDMTYPIPTDLTMLDVNADGAIDRLYFGDLGGQLWRIDLGTDLDPGANTPTGRRGPQQPAGSGYYQTNGYVLADFDCARNSSTGARDCSAATDQDWRRVFYRPDVGAVRDQTYVSSGYVDYDLVTVGTGDRADPLDKLTSSLTEVPVHNRVYAIRDYNIAYGPPTTIPVAYQDSDLYDATSNDVQNTNTAVSGPAISALTASKGWYINLKEASDPAWTALDAIGSRPWIGEKALARTVILAGVVYATTFTPANANTATSTCSPNEGEAKVYALNALDAGIVVDMNGDGTADRSLKVGGGIPSELVTVIREDGTVGLVGASGGGQKINVNNDGSLKRTYWVED
jgi:type IV pilus assembly protein PilY1